MSAGGKVEGAFSVVRGKYHYIAWADGREALFADAADPDELAPMPTREGASAAIAAPLRELTARPATARQQLNEFRALGYLR